MEEELAYLLHNVLQIEYWMDIYVINHAMKDIMVLDLNVGRTVPKDLKMEELIVLNQHPTEEEMDKRFGNMDNVRKKILKAVRRA